MASEVALHDPRARMLASEGLIVWVNESSVLELIEVANIMAKARRITYSIGHACQLPNNVGSGYTISIKCSIFFLFEVNVCFFFCFFLESIRLSPEGSLRL